MGSAWQALCQAWRKVAAWPVGIVGNALFTVFVGTAIRPVRHSQKLDLWARPAARSSSSSSACTGGCAGISTGSRTPERVLATPRGAGARGRLQLLVALGSDLIFTSCCRR
jgi:hypothetical protein